MDEKFNLCFQAGKVNIEEFEKNLAKKNEKIRKITIVRTYLLDSTMELNEEETDIANAIIEIGTNFLINN